MAASFSQSLATFAIPNVDHDDPEPVRTSLAQAHAELLRGELREALRHLRRAAEGADEAGSELRAVALARAAADLATEVGGSLAPPPVKEKEPSVPEASIAVVGPSGTPVSLVRGTTEPALKQLLDSGRAVKVVIKRSVRDEGLYVLRRADAGGAGLGAREAVLVLLEPDDGFWDPAKQPE
jgi:hypothetical protein